IPGFTLPKTTTTIALKGRNSRYASISGPFDDMKILGDLTISDSSVVFPPNTENLLKMINSVRDVGKPKKKSDPQPLPFNLDLMVDLQENLRYVTFPVNIEIMSNSYIHVVYDGNKWIVNDALFASEKGNIDFFGTIFQVDFLSFRIVDAQDLMSVDGDFISRTADGTVVTLNVRTDSDLSKDFLNRISFNLVSDNPDDVSATQILSRLRYNRSMEDLTPEEKQSLLQDEALGIVSQSLNSTLLAPVFYPIQNRIRRFLRLDAFTIQAGFIQNLFTEYQTDSQQLSEIVDMKQLNSDIVQFSSSILLNNLSIGMSKYLGRKIYLDYNFKLQEATDIYSKTQILVRHDTGIRVVLPERLRLSYTFTYEPVEEDVIHEIMLQRSFRF
ncbi:MAG: hypothetical protein PHI68_08815, partial [Candidatus Cloacimonetes bacterium]|nr:hypothetical protein [Candidatus Cloacimonadota bacterium]